VLKIDNVKVLERLLGGFKIVVFKYRVDLAVVREE